MNKKVFLITIYYIIGTIGGLYLKNIILFLILLLCFNFLLFAKNTRKIIIVSIVCIIAFSKSYLLVMHIKNMESVDSVVAIGNIEQITDKGNTRIVSINIEKLNDRKLFFESKIKAYIKNKELKVGDKVSISGTAKKLTYTKNEGCFDYKKYMYSKEIYLNIEANEVKSEKLTLKNYFIKFIDNIRSNIRLTCNRYLPEKNAGITLALVVGEKSELDEDISNIFSQAGLAHIIAISGMHTVYVAYAALVFKKIIGERKSYILAIIIVFLFCNLTNNTESVCRASIMLTLFFLSKILYRKSNSLSNLFISIVLGLIKNPFCIYSPGFILSTAGTFGIITMYEESNQVLLCIACWEAEILNNSF